MKVTINLTDLQMLKAIALTQITEDIAEIVASEVSRTPEIDITETCRNNPQLKDAATVIALAAIATISKGLSNEAV